MLPWTIRAITLRKLAIHDDAYIEAVLARGLRDTACVGARREDAGHGPRRRRSPR